MFIPDYPAKLVRRTIKVVFILTPLGNIDLLDEFIGLAEDIFKIDPDGVKLDEHSISLIKGDKATLTATVTPNNATQKFVTWRSSSDDDPLPPVATVKSGTVTAVSPGTAFIYVTTMNGKEDKCLVTVTNPVSPTGVTLDKTSISLVVGNTVTLTPTVTPSNATNKTVSWSSSNNSVATVSNNGLVTGVGVGAATITVTTVDGNKTATCTITVNPVPVTSVKLEPESVSLFVGKTVNFTPTITPSNATNKSVNWSSSNTAVATVSNSGLITSLSVGMATITVTTVDGNKTATCTVTVNPIPVSSVSVKPSTSLIVGGTETLSPIIIPSNATNQSVTWSSKNPAVAMVSTNGTISAVSVGSTIITVKAEDGNLTADCNVTVVTGSIVVTGVSLNKSSVSLDIGGAETLSAVITPSQVTNQNVTWSSSNPTVATVTGAGKVTAVAPGEAIITVTAADTVNGVKSDSCTVIAISWEVYNQSTWNEVVNRIKNGGNNKNYNITVTSSFSMQGVIFLDFTFGSVTGITVTINGDKEISLAAGSTGNLLCIGENQTVIIKDLDLKGHNSNDSSLVSINGANSSFTMQGSATVSGNRQVYGNSWGGVYVTSGTSTMEDNATVSGNLSSSSYAVYPSSGGVIVSKESTFIMEGGTVYGDVGMPMGNTCSSNITSGAALYVGFEGTVRGTAKYGDGTNILPHTDSKANYTNNTIKR